jgi:hypothetical protein
MSDLANESDLKLDDKFSPESRMQMINNFAEPPGETSTAAPVEVEPDAIDLNKPLKRELESNDEVMPEEETGTAGSSSHQMTKEERKRKKLEFFKRHKSSKVIVAKQIVYREEIPSSATLNEVHPGLTYEFEYNTDARRFICRVEIRVGTPGLVDQVNHFIGEGSSKKDAKKACAHRALLAMYPFSYKPPQHVIDSFNETEAAVKVEEQQQQQTTVCENGGSSNINLKELSENEKVVLAVNQRLLKLCSKPCVAFKTATQLLYECCKQVAETATCVQENGPIEEQRFAYKITNVLDTEAATDENKCAAYGFGKRKQDAKNAACKQALKQFFNFDIDQILASAAAFAAMQQSAGTAKSGPPDLPSFSVNQVAGGPVGVPPPPQTNQLLSNF